MADTDPVIPTGIVDKAKEAAGDVADVVHRTLPDNIITIVIAVAAVIVILRFLSGLVSRIMSFVVLAVVIYFVWKYMPEVTDAIGDIFTGSGGES